MCHFVTLIVPTGDAKKVQAVMERHGRAGDLIDNPSVREVLHEGERQYLTTRGHCDCGTVLAPRHETPEAFEAKLEKMAARMARKGWSDVKIARAIEDRRKADAKPDGGGSDSLELWNTILRDLGDELKLPYAGFLVRFYSRDVSTEIFNVSRREVLKHLAWQEALGSIEHDEVTILPLK